MLYYDCRDIGTINEIETFVENAKPTEHGIHTLLRQFPDFHESGKHQRAATSTTNQFDGVPFPHSIVVIMGHAGSGKTHILKHMASRRRIMFYAPTNPAGINLQNTLAKHKLTAKNRKNIYRTIHSFYRIVPRESNILGECVMSAMKERSPFDSYEQYLITMFRACRPFCDKLFAEEQDEKISPGFYRECRSCVIRTTTTPPT